MACAVELTGIDSANGHVTGSGAARTLADDTTVCLAHAAPAPPTVAAVERLAGQAAAGNRRSVVVTVADLSPPALEFAKAANVAVIVVDLAGQATAATPAGKALLRSSAAAEPGAGPAPGGDEPDDPPATPDTRLAKFAAKRRMTPAQLAADDATVETIRWLLCPACRRESADVLVTGYGDDYCECGAKVALHECDECRSLCGWDALDTVDVDPVNDDDDFERFQQLCPDCRTETATCDLCDVELPAKLLSEQHIVGGTVTVTLCARCPSEHKGSKRRAVYERLAELAEQQGVRINVDELVRAKD